MDKESKQILNAILNKIELMDSKIERMDSKIELMDKRIELLDKRQEEIYVVVKAIEHSNQVHKAEIDNLNHKSAKLESTFNKLANIINEEIA